jgi:hypothetical protein
VGGFVAYALLFYLTCYSAFGQTSKVETEVVLGSHFADLKLDLTKKSCLRLPGDSFVPEQPAAKQDQNNYQKEKKNMLIRVRKHVGTADSYTD